MKSVITFLSASAILASFAFAETASNSGRQTTQQVMQQEHERIQNENQNRFREMTTNELLEKRGSLNNVREREQLHNELLNRYQTMTKAQKEKFTNQPEKESNMQNQSMMNHGMGGGKGGGRH